MRANLPHSSVKIYNTIDICVHIYYWYIVYVVFNYSMVCRQLLGMMYGHNTNNIILKVFDCSSRIDGAPSCRCLRKHWHWYWCWRVGCVTSPSSSHSHPFPLRYRSLSISCAQQALNEQRRDAGECAMITRYEISTKSTARGAEERYPCVPPPCARKHACESNGGVNNGFR